VGTVAMGVLFSCPADDHDPLDLEEAPPAGEPPILKALGSGKLLIEGSLSFKRAQAKHEAAALRLQKVYKSFRTRRQLADCAVLVEQSWCVRSLIS